MSDHAEHSDAFLVYSEHTAEEPARLPRAQGWSLAIALAAALWAVLGLGVVLLVNALHG
jgi:hypothetical protein